LTRPRFFLVLVLILFLFFIHSYATNVRAQSAPYKPGVAVGQFAQYEPVNVTWTSNDPSATEPDILKNINSTNSFSLDIIAVSGPTVTLQYTEVDAGGTIVSKTLTVDVDNGAVNDTNTLLTSNGDYLLLAGMLLFPDPIWNTGNAPTLNLTVAEPVLDIVRNVNFLNTTQYSASGTTSTASVTGLAWDQQSGALVEASYSLVTQSSGGVSKGSYDIVIVDTDIWSAPTPNFSITADPSTINIHQGSEGKATITLASVNGFADNVSLTLVAPSSLISCNLSNHTVAVNGTVTGGTSLSCNGSAGDYSVEVIATSLSGGFIVNSLTVMVKITDFSVSTSSPSLTLETGSTGTITISLTAENSFSDTTALSVASTPQGLSCTLATTSIPGSGSTTLTCQGQPGNYTVTIIATSGSTAHETTMAVQVNPTTPTSPLQPPGILTQAIFYAVIASATIIAVIAAYLLQRRKRDQASATNP